MKQFLRKYLKLREVVKGTHGYINFGKNKGFEINWHLSYWYFLFSVQISSGHFFIGFLCVDFIFQEPFWMCRRKYKETTVEKYEDLENLDGDEWDFVLVTETGKEYMYLNEWIEA